MMTLYVVVSRCERCKKPVLAYRLLPENLSEHDRATTAVPLSCTKQCGWHGAINFPDALKVFEFPWAG